VFNKSWNTNTVKNHLNEDIVKNGEIFLEIQGKLKKGTLYVYVLKKISQKYLHLCEQNTLMSVN